MQTSLPLSIPFTVPPTKKLPHVNIMDDKSEFIDKLSKCTIETNTAQRQYSHLFDAEYLLTYW